MARKSESINVKETYYAAKNVLEAEEKIINITIDGLIENKNKIHEFRTLFKELSDLDITVLSLDDIGYYGEIEESGQPATDAQKEVLSKYVGWGGLSAALDEQKFIYSKGWQADRNWNEKYLPYYTQLRELLTKEEFNDAVQSTNTSHYTPEEIIRGMWNLVQRMGFKGGRINEPAVGVGHIIGLMPSSISEQSIISGTELDSLSGRIAKVLYPDAAIKGLLAMRSPQTVLIGGGYDKGTPYDEWCALFNGRVRRLILLGQTKQDIFDCAVQCGYPEENIYMAETFEEAVSVAAQSAKEGDSVLLSPACASWGMFKSYEQRGDIFRTLVQNMMK